MTGGNILLKKYLKAAGKKEKAFKILIAIRGKN